MLPRICNRPMSVFIYFKVVRQEIKLFKDFELFSLLIYYTEWKGFSWSGANWLRKWIWSVSHRDPEYGSQAVVPVPGANQKDPKYSSQAVIPVPGTSQKVLFQFLTSGMKSCRLGAGLPTSNFKLKNQSHERPPTINLVSTVSSINGLQRISLCRE